MIESLSLKIKIPLKIFGPSSEKIGQSTIKKPKIDLNKNAHSIYLSIQIVRNIFCTEIQ